MDFSKNSIKQLIPQRPPFLMVDRVISCDEINAQTEFIVVADNILLEDQPIIEGYLSPSQDGNYLRYETQEVYDALSH